MMMCLFFPSLSHAQSEPIECGVDIPQSWIPKLIEQAKEIELYVSTTEGSREVPVRFIQVLRTSQIGSTSVLSQSIVDAGLANLNQAFSASGITFIQCAPILFIIDEQSNTGGQFNLGRYTPFEYTTGTLEVYITATSANDHCQMPCPFASQTGNPNYNASCDPVGNYMLLNGAGKVQLNTFIHEAGHHVGLQHTFNPSVGYNNPPTETQRDRPYLILGPLSPDPDPNWYARELVIRSNVNPGTKPFPLQNFQISGDFVGDTPADCASLSGNQIFPGCPTSAQNINTCELDAVYLTYKDYNNDPIFPAPNNLELGRNYMSYWRANCLNKFTTGQMERAVFMYDNFRKPFYGTCGNFTDDVSFWDTGLKIPKVSIRTRHITPTSKSNATTNSSGIFNSMLFDGNVQADVYHNGRELFFAYGLGDNRVHYDHKVCEWIQGVDANDLYLISQNILGLIPFTNGYQIIAADANKSGTISTFDIVQLRNLLKGSISKLPACDQPFRFVPEFVTQDHLAAFNTNPFNMSIPGFNINNLNCTLFTEATNQVAPLSFLVPNTAGKKGFDAIKIGDVDGTWTLPGADCNFLVGGGGSEVVLTVPPSNNIPGNPSTTQAIAQGEVVKLSFKSKNFAHAKAFELGINLPKEYFEFMDIESTVLPDLDKEESFGLDGIEQDKIIAIWYESTGVDKNLVDNSTLFSIKVKAKQAISDISTLVKLDDAIIKNKFWMGTSSTGTQLSNATNEVLLVVEPVSGERESLLNNNLSVISGNLECTPNPTSGKFNIQYNHKSPAVTSRLRIIGLNGQLVKEQNVSLQMGLNTIEVDALQNMPTGTYQVELHIGGETLSSKIIRK
jgi:hypothetical protein